jgi:hypothetical protein
LYISWLATTSKISLIKGKDMDPSSLLNWACENQCKSWTSYFSSVSWKSKLTNSLVDQLNEYEMKNLFKSCLMTMA